MGARLARRGPDGEQRYDDDHLAFVFRRLAIVDVETGDQPIWNEDRSLFVAVNGEIYNHQDLRTALESRHRFTTKSDAEVVLHLYEEHGPAALDRLQGMFAIVVWQPAERRLFLARDRVGIKPLYYAKTDRLLLFGSELKALLAHPACPREIAWADIYPDSRLPRCGLPSHVRGVHQLPGGQYAVFDEGRFQTSRYWAIDQAFGTADPRTTAADVVEQYAVLFCDSARRHLMSDVPVGAMLSGGLDSSMVVAAAAQTTRELHCFHVLEQAVFRSGDSSAARTVTERLGLPLHQVLFPHETLAADLDFDLEAFEYFVWLLDSPRFSLEWFFKHELHRFAKGTIPDLKVMLLGQGADEFAGGYSHAYVNSAGSWPAYLETLAAEERDERLRQSGLDSRLLPLVNDVPRTDADAPPRGAFHREMIRRVERLQRHNLWHEDRTAAGQGVESRVPFLDHRLHRTARVGSRAAARGAVLGQTALARLRMPAAPPEIVNRRKVGFFAVRNMTSIDAIGRDVIDRVFPSFREKYLETADTIFAVDAVGTPL